MQRRMDLYIALFILFTDIYALSQGLVSSLKKKERLNILPASANKPFVVSAEKLS